MTVDTPEIRTVAFHAGRIAPYTYSTIWIIVVFNVRKIVSCRYPEIWTIVLFHFGKIVTYKYLEILTIVVFNVGKIAPNRYPEMWACVFFQTTLEDFHTEIISYGNILNNLDRQLEGYKTTPAYKQQAVIHAFSATFETYQNSLSDLREQVSQTAEYLAIKVNVDSQLVASTTILAQKSLTEISTETYHVSTKLHNLLQQWLCNCARCLPARDPSSRCTIATVMSTDMCMWAGVLLAYCLMFLKNTILFMLSPNQFF